MISTKRPTTSLSEKSSVTAAGSFTSSSLKASSCFISSTLCVALSFTALSQRTTKGASAFTENRYTSFFRPVSSLGMPR